MYAKREDQLASQRKHYRGNKQVYLDKNAKRLARLKKWYQAFKSQLKCSMCPENHPACLHFHHSDPDIKIDSVARMVSAGISKVRILAEIAKCMVLCANCHAKFHFIAMSSNR